MAMEKFWNGKFLEKRKKISRNIPGKNNFKKQKNLFFSWKIPRKKYCFF